MDLKISDKPESCDSLSFAISSKMESDGLISRNNSKSSIFKGSNSVDEHKINLQWKNISYRGEDGTKILNGLCGSTNSGELTAIMGPSGSGKTSLVNALSGFVQKRVSGQILVNGVKRDINAYRKLTCYILQENYILPRFTVRELITFASKLKIPATVSEKDRQRAVDDCIYGLGLVAQQHQRANTLSGGQIKRLCIAQEIVNNPPLIFLDEPTSGLDSSSCIQCVLLLKTMAEQGRNIICTIHQPSSRIFEIFDNLYMLSQGDFIYRGPTKDLLPYLANQGLKCPKYHSPTDFLTDIAIGLYGESLTKLKERVKAIDYANDNWYNETDVDVIAKNEGKSYGKTSLNSVIETIKDLIQEFWQDMKNNDYSASNLKQFQVLVKRSFLGQFRDPLHMKLKFFGSIVIGLLLGFMLYDTGNDGSKVANTAALLFALLAFLVITAKIPTVLTFPLERTIFEREHRNGWYSTKMYYLATTVAEMPYQIVCPIINCGLLYWLSGQPNELHRFCFFLISGVLTALISESIGMMIGAVTNVQNGIFIAAISSGASMLLAGYFLPITFCYVHMRWLYHISFTKYSFSSFLLSILKDRPTLPCSEAGRLCTFKDPKLLLKYLAQDGDIGFNFCIMLAFIAFTRMVTYLYLVFRNSRSK